jgi:hypothetical protein
MSNSLAFGPDGFLYMTQGSNTAMGAADATWHNRPEELLNAAVLKIDPNYTGKLPINVHTAPIEGQAYSPAPPDAPVRLYATGVRNAYDLIWHSSGHLFAATNGSAAGGNTPESPDKSVPALMGVATQDDFLFDIVEGGYYGHPNPLRNEYVLNGGNPTGSHDPAEVIAVDTYAGYPVGVTPPPNWKKFAYNFGRNRSPNGVIEYQNATIFGGRLQKHLLVIEYSGGDDILALEVGANGAIDRSKVVQIASGLSDPLDLAEDTASGNLYVAQLVNGGRDGGAIVLLTPMGTGK